MRDGAFFALVGLMLAVAVANFVLVFAGLLPYYVGGVSILAAFVAIGLAILQARE